LCLSQCFWLISAFIEDVGKDWADVVFIELSPMGYALQEEERLAVQDHLHTTVANTTIWGQPTAPKPSPVPQVPFDELWRATDSFSDKYVLVGLSC
jgi:hypothetical protein